MFVSGPVDRRIAAIAGAQRGRVARRQLLAAGVSSSAVYRRLASGRLIPQHRGVYAVGHTAPVPLAGETAALLACGDPAILSHRSAATLWRLLPPSDGPIDVTVVGHQTGQPCGVRVHETSLLTPRDTRTHEHLPVTSPTRTMLDLTEVCPERDVARALEEGFVLRLIRERDIVDVMSRADGRRGAPVLRAVFERRAEPAFTRTKLERRFLDLIRQAGLAQPEVNARLHGYEVDFLWREQRLAIEVDGYQFHSTRRAFERDRSKGAALAARGINVMRMTWLQTEYEPYTVIARVAQALAWREAAAMPAAATARAADA